MLETAPVGAEIIHTGVELLWNVLERCPSAREHATPPEPEPEPVADVTRSSQESDEEWDEDEEEDEEGEEMGEGVSGAEETETEPEKIVNGKGKGNGNGNINGNGNGESAWHEGGRALDYEEARVAGREGAGLEGGAEQGDVPGESAFETDENAAQSGRDTGSGFRESQGVMAAPSDGSGEGSQSAEPAGSREQRNDSETETGVARELETILGAVENDVENGETTVSSFGDPTSDRPASNGDASSSGTGAQANGTGTAERGVNPPREPFTTDALVTSLAGLMRRYISRGYKKGDKELLNDLLIVAGFLGGDAANLPSFAESGLLELLIAVSCTPELGGSGGAGNILQVRKSSKVLDGRL